MSMANNGAIGQPLMAKALISYRMSFIRLSINLIHAVSLSMHGILRMLLMRAQKAVKLHYHRAM